MCLPIKLEIYFGSGRPESPTKVILTWSASTARAPASQRAVSVRVRALKHRCVKVEEEEEDEKGRRDGSTAYRINLHLAFPMITYYSYNSLRNDYNG